MWRDNKLLLQLFEPEELEALVCGGTDLDFSALQRAAKYEDAFDANSQVCILSLRLSRWDGHCATAYLLSTVLGLVLHTNFTFAATPGSMPYFWGWCNAHSYVMALFRCCSLVQQSRSRVKKGSALCAGNRMVLGGGARLLGGPEEAAADVCDGQRPCAHQGPGLFAATTKHQSQRRPL